MKSPFDLNKLPASLKRQAQINRMTEAERRGSFPATVEQDGLSEDALGQKGFCQSLQERRNWVEINCVGLHFVETIRDNRFRITGRRYHFSNADDAFAFKMRFV